ncbi:hypothetical protein L3Q82_009890 [Scortum barcoo]|uniref:Uncharacterized protein n=1 Tax=Scortum barcoo TaxID=214431 RepID=A0ACB8WE07_9TELE|nr:hypothetical protein L3Q82_009890 [Scortum barcoo]
MSDLYLSFCNSYSLLDLFYGSTSPDNLNCSLDVLGDGDPARCSLCVQAYQRYDQHAQEKYEDFELLTQKYEPGAYSVRTCMEQCKPLTDSKWAVVGIWETREATTTSSSSSSSSSSSHHQVRAGAGLQGTVIKCINFIWGHAKQTVPRHMDWLFVGPSPDDLSAHQTAYKPWLCAQYFPTTQQSCQKTVPCHQYCLEVQQSCPFILPDNDDLIHGGSPSFICTGLLEDHLSDSEAECCDVRWDSKMDNPSGGTLKRTASSCQPEGASVTSAATPRLCSGRLKICLLALVLLHTVIIISASHNSTLVGVAAIFSPEESASNEE